MNRIIFVRRIKFVQDVVSVMLGRIQLRWCVFSLDLAAVTQQTHRIKCIHYYIVFPLSPWEVSFMSYVQKFPSFPLSYVFLARNIILWKKKLPPSCLTRCWSNTNYSCTDNIDLRLDCWMPVRAVFTWVSKVICVYFGFASLRLLIGLKNLRHFLNQSQAKPKPIVICSRKLSRA